MMSQYEGLLYTSSVQCFSRVEGANLVLLFAKV
jgi:hypothetical protein